MNLSWISIALTFTALFIWWFGNNQPLGFAVFMAGGILWFVAQKIQSLESKVDKSLEEKYKSTDKKKHDGEIDQEQ
jgi:hypothetical protein